MWKSPSANANLLVTMSGRWATCRHCGDTDHWSKKGPTSAREAPNKATESFLQKVLGSQHYPWQRRIDPRPTTEKDYDAREADVESHDTTISRWWWARGRRDGGKGQRPSGKTYPTNQLDLATEDLLFEMALQFVVWCSVSAPRRLVISYT